MTELLKLERNDVDGALRLRREMKRAGVWTVDCEEVIVMLQDDPAALIAALKNEPR